MSTRYLFQELSNFPDHISKRCRKCPGICFIRRDPAIIVSGVVVRRLGDSLMLRHARAWHLSYTGMCRQRPGGQCYVA